MILIAEEHYVACTLMVKDENGRYVFLVEQEGEGYSFPASSVETKKTALSCIIERVKKILKVEVDKLELYELTNAVVNGYRVPLYVFTYEDGAIQEPSQLLPSGSELYWLHAENLTQTLEEWEITGVPQFLFI